MSLVILFHFLCTQHVSDINISIAKCLRLCCWITTLVVLFSVRCVGDLVWLVLSGARVAGWSTSTCWAHKKWNKIASDIKLVFYSSTITMMHGPINVRLLIDKLIFPQLFNPHVFSNRKFFLLHTTKSLVPVISLKVSIEGRPSYSFKIRRNNKIPSTPRSSKLSLSFRFFPPIPCKHLSSHQYAPHVPPTSNLLDLITLIIYDDQYKSRRY